MAGWVASLYDYSIYSVKCQGRVNGISQVIRACGFRLPYSGLKGLSQVLKMSDTSAYGLKWGYTEYVYLLHRFNYA
jgi:hypothetical protein